MSNINFVSVECSAAHKYVPVCAAAQSSMHLNAKHETLLHVRVVQQKRGTRKTNITNAMTFAELCECVCEAFFFLCTTPERIFAFIMLLEKKSWRVNGRE